MIQGSIFWDQPLLASLPPVCQSSRGLADNYARGAQAKEWMRHSLASELSPARPGFLAFAQAADAIQTLGTTLSANEEKADVLLRLAKPSGYALIRVAGTLHTEGAVGESAGNQLRRAGFEEAMADGLLPQDQKALRLAKRWLEGDDFLTSPEFGPLTHRLAERWEDIVDACAFGGAHQRRADALMAVAARGDGSGYDRAMRAGVFAVDGFMAALKAFGAPLAFDGGRKFGNAMVWLQRRGGAAGQEAAELVATLNVSPLLSPRSRLDKA